MHYNEELVCLGLEYKQTMSFQVQLPKFPLLAQGSFLWKRKSKEARKPQTRNEAITN